MNSFDVFNDFRVSAWKDRSLMITLSEAVDHVAATVKGSLAVVATVCAVIGASVLVPTTAMAQSTESPEIQFSFNVADPIHDELAAISRTIDAELDALMDFSSIDESVLAMANQAVFAMAARPTEPASDWANKVFPEGQ